MFNNLNFLVLWLTNDCNLRCKYCYANAGDKKDYMSFETAKKAINVPKSKFKLQLAGGEPLLNFSLIKDIYNYLQANRPDIKMQMQTNGTLITREIAREIRKMNISVGVSLDGPVEINEKFRGKTVAAINGIKNLAREGVMVNLNSVITSESIEHLDKLVDLAFYLGNVGGIGLDLLRETGRTCNNNVKIASENQIRKYVRKAYHRSLELSEITGRRIVIREVEDARRRMLQNIGCTEYCHAVYGGSMVVTPQGHLYPCGSLVSKEEYYMGNINNTNSFKEVRIKSKRPETCSLCKYRDICVGACPARSIINGKNNRITLEECALRKTAFEIIEEVGGAKQC